MLLISFYNRMSDIKTFTITKEAAKAVGVGGTRRKRKPNPKQPLPEEDFSRKSHGPVHIQKHGGAVPPVPAVAPAPAPSPSPAPAPSPAVPVAPAAPVVTVNRSTAQGGYHEPESKNVRVELKKKTEVKSVHLRPKSDAPKKVQTKRRSKLTLGISSLRKRITRAKHIHRNVKNMPLDKLKEELIKKNLIRPTSKAPESVLRQIARDSQMVATSM
jgi:hypothetical protein